MINEANDHPRYAVDVQRDQSKPGHPHATVIPLTYTDSKQKAREKRKKQLKHGQTDLNIPQKSFLDGFRQKIKVLFRSWFPRPADPAFEGGAVAENMCLPDEPAGFVVESYHARAAGMSE